MRTEICKKPLIRIVILIVDLLSQIQHQMQNSSLLQNLNLTMTSKTLITLSPKSMSQTMRSKSPNKKPHASKLPKRLAKYFRSPIMSKFSLVLKSISHNRRILKSVRSQFQNLGNFRALNKILTLFWVNEIVSSSEGRSSIWAMMRAALINILISSLSKDAGKILILAQWMPSYRGVLSLISTSLGLRREDSHRNLRKKFICSFSIICR